MPFNSQFTPADGLLNTSSYPAQPASEEAARQQFMDLFNLLLGNDIFLKSLMTVEALKTPTFLNNWVQREGYQTAGYFKDGLGFVHLQGNISSGAFGTIAFQLPAGYRPLPADSSLGGLADFATESGQGMSMIEIDTGGNVNIKAGATTLDVSLNIAPFLARA